MIRVLHAEDDPQIADMVRLYFAYVGGAWTVDHVGTGRLCLQAMERNRYDVLLLDLMMPDLDGLQVLGELTSRGDPTPVIMVSAQGQHDLAVRALRAGAVDCIDKNSPDFRRIHEIVERVHARQRPRPASPATPPARRHRVLFVEPNAAERSAVALFFTASARRLELFAESPSAFEALLGGTFEFDAVVLGPSLDTVAMFDALRHLRARREDLPVIVISPHDHAETTIAAFKLGAHDYLLRGPDTLGELVFSLNHALKRADTERLNTRLTQELATLNHSLAAQVAARTAELEQEVGVRRAAEQRAEEQAARLHSLSKRLLRVQEDERRSLAQELHDQIGQLLTGLRFQLEAARVAAP
ncbi:MAG: response regulator, partial [Verrucomicrobiota bacterium]